jgi:hypothetical protein
MLRDENYITIQGWMIKELELKGNELLVYAVIYGFSQNEENKFRGSRRYLAEWCNSTLYGIDKVLNKLIEKNLIIKYERIENGVKFCDYECSKLCWGVVNFVDGGSKQSCHHNIEDNIDKENISNKLDIKERFKKPTIEEIKLYCEERKNNIDGEKFYDFYESKGWMVGKNKMKDWKACIRTWENRNKVVKKKENLDDIFTRMKKEGKL